jgi:Zn-dependent peptidase ImmA (M78 family)/DNA-binding XRE family transcriptional regulator
MKVNPDMLILARESRGLTQGELAIKVGIGQSALSKYENGLIEVPDQHLQQIAKELRYPETLFTRRSPVIEIGVTCMHHRKRQTLPTRDLRRIQAKANLTSLRIERLLRSVEIGPIYEFPRLDIAEYMNPGRIAELVRHTWRLPIGPVKDLVGAVERAGGIIIPFHFGTRKLDAISQWPPGLPPLFFINEEMPAERIRFSLAHEIGHLVMHLNISENAEREADAFASAFLMPAKDIEADLSGMSLARAAQLKPYWRVSMQALIRQAYDLKRISEFQYRRLFTQLSKLGYRLQEPISIASEQPATLRTLIETHIQSCEYTEKDLCDLLDMHPQEFREVFTPWLLGPIRVVG